MANNRLLTEAQKGFLFDAGSYSFPAPPVCTGLWDRAAWIAFVDACGQWGNLTKARAYIRRIHEEE
jgi:pentatricopeptide repeat protein